MKRTIIFILVCLTVSVASASRPTAQEIETKKAIESTRPIFAFGGDSVEADTDSVRKLIDTYYLDQYRHFQDPRAPYFMLMSRDAHFAMGIGGMVKLRGWYDFDGSVDGDALAPYSIKIPSDPGANSALDGSASGTAIFLKVIGFTNQYHHYSAYIEGSFAGYAHVGFKLKYAYLTWDDWTLGYAKTTFADPACEPPGIDGSGPNGVISRTSLQLRWLHTIRNTWCIGASAELASAAAADDGISTRGLKMRLPTVVWLAQWQWAGAGQHLRLSGIMRSLPYRDLATEKNRNVPAWGVQLSATGCPLWNLRLFGIANYGRGFASYTGDLSIGDYDLINDPDSPGRMTAPYTLGLTGGITYNFRSDIYATIAAGHVRYYPHRQMPSDEYKSGLYTAANVFWDITPRVRAGLEYAHAVRTDFSSESGHANRIGALFQFSF